MYSTYFWCLCCLTLVSANSLFFVGQYAIYSEEPRRLTQTVSRLHWCTCLTGPEPDVGLLLLWLIHLNIGCVLLLATVVKSILN